MLQVKPFHIRGFLPLPYQEALAPRLSRIHQQLQTGGSWVHPQLDGQILSDAAEIRRTSQALVVIGSGEAFLGARGVIHWLCSPSYNLRKKETPNIYFVDSSSVDAVREALGLVEGTDFSIAVSGEDAETGAALRVFRQRLEACCGQSEAKRRLYAGHSMEAEDRCSLFTPAGLLPMAVAGVDVAALTQGAADMAESCAAGTYDCPAWQYAALRYELYRTGRPIEVLVCRAPAFRSLLEWWRQLFSGGGEKGILPVAGAAGSLPFAGQSPQWDKRPLFETLIQFNASCDPLTVPGGDFGDGLDFLAGESLDYIGERALEGALLAHTESGVPCVVLEIGSRTPEDLGRLVYFFQYVSALCWGLLAPLSQPETAAYQQNLSALLGQPGCAGRKMMLEERLHGSGALWTLPQMQEICK